MSFLPIKGRTARYTFMKPNRDRRSASGLYHKKFSGVGYLTGSISFQALETTTKVSQLLGALQTADLAGGFFFADLMTPDLITSDAPVWHDGNQYSDRHSLGIDSSASGHGIEAGDIVSIRVNVLGSASNYVTARIITGTNASTAYFNHPLPSEFFRFPSWRLQYCTNRPHVRAVFGSDTARWNIDYNEIVRVSTVNWVEDTAGIVYGLRSIQAATPVAPTGSFLVKVDGGYITLVSGGYIQLV